MTVGRPSFILVLLLASIGSNSEPIRSNTPGFWQSMRDSATAFVDQYYSSLSAGIPRSDLDDYWSNEMLIEFDNLSKKIAKETGESPEIETRRLLDIDQVHAKCQRISLRNVEIGGVISIRAKLEYDVQNRCLHSTDKVDRTVGLIKEKSDWRISYIREIVAE